jgi:hypothetical protein
VGGSDCVSKKLKETSSHEIEELKQEGFWLSGMGLSVLLGAVTFVWLTFGLIAYNLPATLEESGQSGDMFGGVTALFSGLAFAGLIFTLFVQKQELRYQRKELSYLVTEQRETKGHLKDQATHLKSQSDFIEKQIFENSFFQLLSSFNEYIANTKIKEREDTREGHDAYEAIYKKLSRRTNGFVGRPDSGSIIFLEHYNQFYYENIDDLGPYYRQLYNILKFIRLSNIDDSKFYSNILRAQISRSELSLLACNIASSFGSKKMAPLVKEFDILKHCDDAEFLKSESWDNYLDNFFTGWDFYDKLESDQLLQYPI